MNELEAFFFGNNHRLMHKWSHYFDIYDKHFRRFRGQKIKVVEIGVYHGGSMEMWQAYFGDKAEIIGVDNNPASVLLSYDSDRLKVLYFDQSRKKDLEELAALLRDADIIIDDGSHRMRDQILTFKHLYPILKTPGIYLCEDTHTSYLKGFGGRFHNFIRFTKTLIDRLHNYNARVFRHDIWLEPTNSITYYDGIVVFEKSIRAEAPYDIKSGYPTIADPNKDHLDIER